MDGMELRSDDWTEAEIQVRKDCK